MKVIEELILIIIGLIMIIGTMTYILVQDAYSLDCNKLNYSEFKDIEELRNITRICSNGG